MRDLFREELDQLLPHIEDDLRKDKQMYCSQSFLGGRPVTTPGLQVGDTVQVVGPECKGLVGELRVIDPNNDEAGDFFGIRFDGVDGYIFFREDEIKKVGSVPQNCDKCGQKRKTLTNTGTEAYPVWKCGTCLHREARRINTREMYGKGRRGY